MKILTTLITASFLLIISLSAHAGSFDYIVKSFKLLGDDVTSQQITKFSKQKNAELITCDVYEAELICVFKIMSSK